MARPQATSYSPIMEHHQEGHDLLDDDVYSTSGCCCFRFFSSKTNVNEPRNSWVVDKLKKVKEVSEKIAGPKWKTLIRKISVYMKKLKKPKNTQFQYDAESYALNFDGDREEDDLLVPIFSTRFSAPSSAHQNGL